MGQESVAQHATTSIVCVQADRGADMYQQKVLGYEKHLRSQYIYWVSSHKINSGADPGFEKGGAQ